jgi:phytoene synthase
VPDQVTEPALGQIRLQWWRDALKAGAEGGGGDAPAVRAAADVVARRSLPIEPFLALADARSADLYSDPPPTLADLMELLSKMQSAVFELAARVAGAGGLAAAEAARHAGIAYGLALRLAGLARDRVRGRTIFTHDLLAMEELDADDFFVAEPAPGLHNVSVALANLARHHLRAAREHVSKLPAAATPVFLPLAIVEPLLDRLDQLDAEIFQRTAGLSDLEMLSRIAWARVRGLG